MTSVYMYNHTVMRADVVHITNMSFYLIVCGNTQVLGTDVL